jgi:ribonuclease P protein component
MRTSPSAPPRRSEAFDRTRRIAARRDYQATYDAGAKRHGRLVTVFAKRNDNGVARLGVTVTKKVGGAAVRNLLKRRVREIYRTREAAPGLDVVVNLKREAREASFAALREDLARVLSALETRRADA